MRDRKKGTIWSNYIFNLCFGNNCRHREFIHYQYNYQCAFIYANEKKDTSAIHFC